MQDQKPKLFTKSHTFTCRSIFLAMSSCTRNNVWRVCNKTSNRQDVIDGGKLRTIDSMKFSLSLDMYCLLVGERDFLRKIGASGQCCSWMPVRWSTGNDVSGHYFHHHFFSSRFPPVFSLSLSTFLIEGVLESKKYFSKVDGSTQIYV